ncbi:MAG: TIGR00295 family protein [Methanobacteriaceae archaeon]|nr:TIGR00295 family protein [Methanobacteriaceae archaeon]
MTLELLRQFKCSQSVIEHCQAVAKKALEISRKFSVDSELVKNGALLHDIGRGKTHGIEHAVVGAGILKDLGFSREMVNIVERHIGAGIPLEEAKSLGLPPKDYLPLTLNEKIVAHADNLINGVKEVHIDFVIEKWEKRLGYNHPSIERLINLHREIIDKNYSPSPKK